MHNSDIIRELLQALKDMDFFVVYPDSKDSLRTVLASSVSDSGRIRAILTDLDVQEFLFPDYRAIKGTVYDPVEHYVSLRRLNRITPR